MNPMEFNMTRRLSWPCEVLSCSTPTPEMRETYPGTRGRTQGDRKEISPATKTPSGSGRFNIDLYCTCLPESGGRPRQSDALRSFLFQPSFSRTLPVADWRFAYR